MFITIAVLLISAPFVWWYLFLLKYKPLDVIPGPNPLPLVGNAFDLGATPQDFYKNCMKLCKQYGDMFKIYIANEVKVFIGNADFLEKILSSNEHITKSNGYDLAKPFLNLGLLTSTGKKWKIRRKMITPTFHFQILDQFLAIFNSSGDILVQKLSQEVGKHSIDLLPYIELLSLDVVCETAMGVKISSQEGQNSEYVTSLRKYFDIMVRRFFSSWKRFDTLFRFSPEYQTQEYNLNVLLTFSRDVIEKRRAEKAQQKLQPTISEEGIKRRVALLDMLLESELNNEDIKEEINTFMFEGHDTTTSGISFALWALAENRDIQDRVYDEIVSVVGEDSCIMMQQLQEMKYLEMVIKEVQRMYSSVPFVERHLETDFNINGINFPKDTTLTLYLYGVHHNEKYFPEPEKFDPDRFLPEKQAKRHKYAFVPFSAGPRNCIGQKYAMMDMKVIIIKILQKFVVLPVPGYKPELGMAVVLKSYNGIRVQIKSRSV